MISKFQVGLKSLLRQGLSEHEFFVTWCINWRGSLALIIFQRSLLKWFPIIKRLVITLMYCNRRHAWWSTQSWLATLLSSLIARQWVGLQTLWRFRLKDLSIDEMVGTWCIGFCQVHLLDFSCSGIQVYVLWSPCLCFISFFILIYMFLEMRHGYVRGLPCTRAIYGSRSTGAAVV